MQLPGAHAPPFPTKPKSYPSVFETFLHSGVLHEVSAVASIQSSKETCITPAGSQPSGVMTT